MAPLIAALLGAALADPEPVAAQPSLRVCGDVDGDGIVSDTDGVLVLLEAANLPSPCKDVACDVDGDARITQTDAVLVLRKAVALPVAERCGLGAVSGTVVVPDLGHLGGSEREPNDSAAIAHVLGRLAAGDTRRVTGHVDPSADPFDGFLVVIDGPATLELDARFPDAGADLDLLVADAASAQALACEGVRPGRESCRVGVGAARAALHVAVAPAAGSPPSDYTLTIRARAARARGRDLAAGRGAALPRALATGAYRGDEADFVPGEVIVQRGTAGPARAAHVADALADAGIAGAWEVVASGPSGGALLQYRRLADAAAADAPAARAAAKRALAALRAETREAVARLARSPLVAYAQLNHLARPARIPNDPLLGLQWHYAQIGMAEAWDLTVGADDVVVAVLDTGVRSDHPDLAARLIAGYDFISSVARANDGDGPDPDPFDPGDLPGSALGGSFHGTHVAGTIAAATDDARGVAGVTWRTRLMPVRVLGVGGGSTFDIAEAIRFAAGLPNASGIVPPVPAGVINLSLFAFGDQPFMRAAVDDATAAGALVVAAAGNTGSDVPVSPAVFENSLAVAATDLLGAPAGYSAFGAAVDLSAPGGDTGVDLNADGENDGVLSTLVPGARDFARLQGTSMACAHVSGIAALLLARGGPAPPAALRAALLATAGDRGAPGRDDRYGAGMVDPAAAIRAFAGLPPPSAPVLALDTATLGFGSTRGLLGVHARNAGGGALVVAAPRAATDDALGWLAATFAAATSTVEVRVERAHLLAGAYSGRVEVPSNGGTRTIGVRMEVAPRPAVDVGPVTVVLLAPGSGAEVARTVTTFGHGYAYRIEGARGGSYELRAGTDDDGDGAICEPGELCGGFPVLRATTPVTVIGGEVLEGRDFVLAPVTQERP